jgi:nucleoside-diphosphate-sugar epimerase
VLGRPTIPKLIAAGHQVTALARGPEKAAQVQAAGATPVDVDLFEPNGLNAATAGHDAVLHLATKIPPVSKAARTSSWDENNRIRTEGTRNLVDAALANGVGLLVKESIAFTYADGGDAWLDEESPVDVSRLIEPTIEGEQIALAFAGDGRRAVVLRFGFFHAAGAAHTDNFLKMARMRVAPVLGSPDGYQSIIHVDDAADAVVAALQPAVMSGIYNVVDDEPLTRRRYSDALGAALGGKKLHMPPKVLAKVGGSKADYLARSQRVSNAKFKQASGWAPAHPTAAETWEAIVSG